MALVVAYAAVRRDRHRSSVLLFLWWTLGLSVATLIQKRFFNSASVAVSLLLALCICWTYAKLPASASKFVKSLCRITGLAMARTSSAETLNLPFSRARLLAPSTRY